MLFPLRRTVRGALHGGTRRRLVIMTLFLIGGRSSPYDQESANERGSHFDVATHKQYSSRRKVWVGMLARP